MKDNLQHSKRRNQISRICQSATKGGNDDDDDDDDNDIGTPIELQSLQETPTFFGIEKTQEFDALDTGVPLFTGAIIFVLSIYFMVSLVFFEPDPSLFNELPN